LDRRDYILKPGRKTSGLQKILILTLMIAIGLMLFMFEIFLPQPIPGGKIGLSQLVTLLVLVWFGWLEALVVVLLRVVIGSLILGTLFNPIFLLGFAGAIVSLLVMTFVYQNLKKFSIIGVSIFGALFHNLTQLCLAYWLFVPKSEIFWLIPYFILVSLFSGLLIGFTTWFLHQKLSLIRL